MTDVTAEANNNDGSDNGKGRAWQRIKLTRDGLLLGTGIVLTIFEVTIRQGAERPYILILLSGMMGLPVFLRQDEKKNGNQ